MKKQTYLNNIKSIVPYFYRTIEILFIYVLSIIIASPLVGTIFALLDIYWGIIAVVFTLIIAGIFTYCIDRLKIFRISGWKSMIVLVAIFMIGVIVYRAYSPVLELRQDPSLYLFRSMNLLNYGHIYAPMDITKDLISSGLIGDASGYATLQNGTSYVDGVLYSDFYPGGSFFYALVGFFAKSKIFYSMTFISVINGILIYAIINKLTNKINEIACGILTISFMVAPLMVWFGRGSFSEPVAMTYFLVIFYLLLNEKINNYVIMVVLLASLTARIDYIVLMVVGIFILTNLKILDGLIFTVLACIETYICSKVYWIYYNRISTNDMKMIKYAIPMLIIIFILSLIIKKLWKNVDKFYRSKPIVIIFAVVCFCLSLFAFRNNIISEYEMASIHGRDLRTYVEEIFDLLFMVFPSIILVGGLLGMFRMIYSKKINFLASVFFVGCFTAYSYFFITAGNSPQLYWMLRRYYNILIPVLFISFSYLIEKIDKQIAIIISIACLLISSNLLFDSNQTVDYANLDKGIIQVSDYLYDNDVDVVFYYSDLRYQVSSLMSYSEAEFIEISEEDNLSDITEYISAKEINSMILYQINVGSLCKFSQNVNYSKIGESYGQVPTETYLKNYIYNLYDLKDFNDNIEKIQSFVFPSWSTQGIYDDNEWLNGDTTFTSKDPINLDSNLLYIELYNYNQYYIDNDLFDELDLKVYIDGQKLDNYTLDENMIICDTKDFTSCSEIRITSNVFVPSIIGSGSDTRELGLPVSSIYFK